MPKANLVLIEGLPALRRKMKALPEFVKVNAQSEIDVSAFQGLQEMRSLVRRRTGALARALTWASRPRSVSAVVGVEASPSVPKNLPYWLEFGTVTAQAFPFIRPVVERMRADHEARLGRALEQSAIQLERVT